uniref:LysR family transcriptional regulator n=1 Tax=Schlesneria paludicola TaxID=360056 RepID=A0A7C4QQ32_9PLAN
MTLRDIELFCEVASQRSFSKAARTLGVSQPVASETVKSLEEHLGTELINRSQRPLELTPAGQVYFEGCRELLNSFRRLEDRLLQLRDKVVGPVRVAAIYSVGLLQMDTYVKHFQQQYPEAQLELRYLHPDEVLRRVLNDEADLGLLSFPPKRAELVNIPWQSQEMVLAVPPQHRLAARQKIQVAELNGESMVTFTPGLQIRTEIDRWLRQAKVDVAVVHEFDNIENIKRAVEVGSGVALLPVPTVRRELEIGSLRIVHLEDVQWYRPLGIIHRKHKVLTTAVKRFLELLQQPPESFLRGDVSPPSKRAAAR